MGKQSSDVLKSKRFWSGLIGLLAILIVGVHPSLESHIDTIVPGVLGIIGILIGGYTAQDVAREVKKDGAVASSTPTEKREPQIVSVDTGLEAA